MFKYFCYISVADKYITVQMFRAWTINVFEGSLTPMIHLFDKKYSKNITIMSFFCAI